MTDKSVMSGIETRRRRSSESNEWSGDFQHGNSVLLTTTASYSGTPCNWHGLNHWQNILINDFAWIQISENQCKNKNSFNVGQLCLRIKLTLYIKNISVSLDWFNCYVINTFDHICLNYKLVCDSIYLKFISLCLLSIICFDFHNSK